MITDFEIYNNFGRVNAAASFALFGPLPAAGAFCELRNPKFFNHLTGPVALHLDWAGLPDGDLSLFKLLISLAGQEQEVPLFSSVIPLELNQFGNSLRLVLSAPAEAFGHSTYAARIIEAMVQRLPPPKPPFVPVVNKIWLTSD